VIRAASAASAVGLALLVVAASAHAYVYWTDFNSDAIGRSALDGTLASNGFVSGANQPRGVAVDAGHLYWGNFAGTIGRSRIDGGGVEQGFVSGIGNNGPCGVAVDSTHVYWANNVGGSIGNPCGIAIGGGYVYWLSGGSIGRASLATLDVNRTFIAIPDHAAGLAVDATHLYWGNGSADAIGRAGIDGAPGSVEPTFLPISDQPEAVAVDGAHLYWGGLYTQTIGRSNLDGTAPNQFFVTGIGFPAGLATDPLPSNAFSVESVTAKTVTVAVTAPGTVEVGPAAAKGGPRLGTATSAGGPPAISVALNLTHAARADLKRKKKLSIAAAISFTPTGGSLASQVVKLKLKLNRRGKHAK
jgi:hypothetical protein